MALRRSALYDACLRSGARVVPFGGWEMPLSYARGTLFEHRSCRTDAVVFDVSHLGTVRVAGPTAFDRLQRTFTNDLGRIRPGRAQYTHLLDEEGSVLDDLIVWWLADERFEVMPNASNTGPVRAALGADGAGACRPPEEPPGNNLRDAAASIGGQGRSWRAGSFPAAPEVVDVTDRRAVLAVQGPRARQRLGPVWPEAARVGRFAVAELEWRAVPCTVAGTGYTGEDGLECAVPVERAPELWQCLLDVGVEPAGLGARDTLRLEAGLPLHGHELGPGITPLQAGLEWVVAWHKEQFPGRMALEAERKAGPHRRLRGLVLDSRQPPRAGQRVLVDGAPVGQVTSGNFSPMLEQGIALAFLPPEADDGDEVEVEVRDRTVPAAVVTPPFVRRVET